MAKVKRYYGIDRGSLGDIFYNNKTKEISSYLDLGAFGRIKIFFKKRDDNCYDLSRKYQKDSEEITYRLGRTFPVKDKDKKIVEGITQTALALFSAFDKDSKKNLSSTNDCLIITTHKLKEQTAIKDKEGRNTDLIKIGYVTGKFAIEADSSEMSELDEIPF